MLRLLAFGFSITAGIATAGLFYHSAVKRGVDIGVKQEQVRVQASGETVAKKIARAQRDAARKPAPSVLDRWSVD
jgi:hypothetical protein